MIVSHQMQNRGVQIMNGDWILDRTETKFVGGSIDAPLLDPSTGHPKRKSPVVVVPALTGTRTILPHLDRRSPSKLAGAKD